MPRPKGALGKPKLELPWPSCIFCAEDVGLIKNGATLAIATTCCNHAFKARFIIPHGIERFCLR
jgi:hypothetical protein